MPKMIHSKYGYEPPEYVKAYMVKRYALTISE